MTKMEYLKKLKHALRRVKADERKKSLAYFSEVIDDRMEDGIPESDAVAELESVEAAAERIIAEAEAQGQLKKRLSAWEVSLIVVGFPLWFPVLLTIGIVLLTLYLLVWIIIVTLFLVSAALVVAAPAGIVGLFQLLDQNVASAFAVLATGLVGSGLGIALFIPVLYIAQAYLKATPLMWNKLTGRKAGY